MKLVIFSRSELEVMGGAVKALTILYFYYSPLLAAVNGEERIKELRRKYNLPV